MYRLRLFVWQMGDVNAEPIEVSKHYDNLRELKHNINFEILKIAKRFNLKGILQVDVFIADSELLLVRDNYEITIPADYGESQAVS